jgi:hypothetical protein
MSSLRPKLEKTKENWGGFFYFTLRFHKFLLCPHCNQNPSYVFFFWKLRGLSPKFHIHVSVSNLYIPRIGPHISCSSRIGRSIEGIQYINRSQTHECENCDCVRAIPFWEYLFQVFGIGFLQCSLWLHALCSLFTLSLELISTHKKLPILTK